MKVLVVTYLPGGEKSNTKKVLEGGLEVLKVKKVNVEVLDLTKDVPDLFSPERLAVYYDRNYGGQKISAQRMAFMAKMDRMTAQLKTADILVLACPMHNFSLPASVKAWLDSVMLKGETWDFTPTGYVGLLKGKKALFVSSSGGEYEGQLSFLEHSASLAKADLGFMGFEMEAAVAAGVNKFPDKTGMIVAAAQSRAKTILEKWLG